MTNTDALTSYANVAHAVAGVFHRRHGRHCTYDELHAAALVGVWRAVERSDASDEDYRPHQVGAYARQLAANEVRDWVRGTGRYSRSGRLRRPDVGAHPLGDAAHWLSDGDWECSRRGHYLEAELEAAHRRLTWPQRLLLTLRFREGMGWAEVAESMGIKRQAVFWLYARALAKLRVLLKETS